MTRQTLINFGAIFEEVNWRNEAVNVGKLQDSWHTHHSHTRAFSGGVLLRRPFSYIEKPQATLLLNQLT